jgi:hypothetical protein
MVLQLNNYQESGESSGFMIRSATFFSDGAPSSPQGEDKGRTLFFRDRRFYFQLRNNDHRGKKEKLTIKKNEFNSNGGIRFAKTSG